MMASASDVISLTFAVYEACDAACAAKKLLSVAGKSMDTLMHVLYKIKSGPSSDDPVVFRVLQELEAEILITQRIVDKAKKTNCLVFFVKAKGLGEDLEANLRRIQLTLMTLEATRNEQLFQEVRRFHETYREQERILKDEAQRERLQREGIMDGDIAANIAGITGNQSREELEKALREIKNERSNLLEVVRKSQDSVKRDKLKMEKLEMDQIIAALELSNSEKKNGTPKTSHEQLPDWCLCPITAEIMKDPVIVNALCSHTCSREALEE
mmetsp:Transcript_30508/g.91103  ORF Transcript_30508/g.91103 Transcript_30508/m.91103 type:complete len:270 (-) Transcript_30508:1983-2792(-)